jgi:hypothetical protein
MIAYNWTIATCEHEVATGGITVAHWRVAAVDGEHTVSAYGSASFTPDATAPNFKPYDQVSETEVLGWVWASLDKAEIEANLAAQIETQKAPVTATGTPWT